jgi:Winged helix-turn helix
MLGLVPGSLEVTPRGRATRVRDAVRQEIDRLKALYAGFHYRELAHILFFTFGYPIHHNTVKQLWHQSPMTAPQQPARGDYHAQPNRAHARLQMVQLYYQGWDKMSLSRFFRISRPTVDRWIACFETNHFAELMDHKRGPQSPRKVWFSVMVAVYHLQKRHPDAGEFRLWSLLVRPDLSVLLALLEVPVDDSPWQALDPTQHRQHIIDALKYLLLRESQIQPLCLVVENLHWIDAETHGFLDSLVESLPAARVLLLVSYRPEYRHDWGSKTYYTQLRIDPLPPESAAALLRSLMGDDVGAHSGTPLRELAHRDRPGGALYRPPSYCGTACGGTPSGPSRPAAE